MSQKIENENTTTAWHRDRPHNTLFRYADDAGEHADAATKEALRYRTALYQGFQSLSERPLPLRTAVDICTAIKGVTMDVRRTPGTQLVNHAAAKPSTRRLNAKPRCASGWPTGNASSTSSPSSTR